ncbi:MATE family efflux transporter [Vespertiliibacter pulmonis]|uniref:Multidrug-efflux transporter n=1 Tax=Vespertiliibacter pulmonis TaxID=1443036 RepID=A0A3N4W5J5_9PAST|nr:MATE family efflux transporter [Vespertiliibacter pulmonis]QLB20442.1 MATE family efflux transporter [Vespertiliibacter pulmonis]RPE86431.1 MATE family multidrug resistance protein [Vespertiliibacter pulmonis]
MNFQWQKYPENTRNLLKLSIPILISQLATSGMGLSDIIMAGLVSDADVSAIAVSNSIYFPLFLFVLGILNAITPTVSYLNGAGRRDLIAHQIRQGFWIASFFGILLLVVCLNSHIFLDFMNAPKDFSGKAQQYLAVLCIGVIPALLSVNLRCLNDGLANPKPAMMITFFALLLNIPLNYIFIFGKFGLPAMGAVGCGVATAIANWVMFGLMLHYCYVNKAQRDIKLFDKWLEMPSVITLTKLFKLGLPIGFALLTEVMLFSASSLVISPLGSQAVASHQIALQTSSFFFMLPLSFGIATTILVGKTLGKKQLETAKCLSYHAIFTGIAMSLIMALIMLVLRGTIPKAFTSDPTSVLMASGLLVFAAIYQIPDAIQVVCNGIMRGYKHTKPTLVITLLCYWGLGIPFGYVLSMTNWIVEPMGAAGFWLMFCICLTLASGLLFYQMRKIQSIPEQELIAKLESIR